MEIMFHEFTVQDWYAFSGAEVKDGVPLIADVTLPLDGQWLECQVVLDDNGINLDYWEPKQEVIHDFALPMDGQGLQAAQARFSQLNLEASSITVHALQTLGFVYNRCP